MIIFVRIVKKSKIIGGDKIMKLHKQKFSLFPGDKIWLETNTTRMLITIDKYSNFVFRTDQRWEK